MKVILRENIALLIARGEKPVRCSYSSSVSRCQKRTPDAWLSHASSQEMDKQQ